MRAISQRVGTTHGPKIIIKYFWWDGVVVGFERERTMNVEHINIYEYIASKKHTFRQTFRSYLMRMVWMRANVIIIEGWVSLSMQSATLSTHQVLEMSTLCKLTR